MRKTQLLTLLPLIPLLLAASIAQGKSDKSATKVEDVIWAHGTIYDTVLTGNSFKSPPAHSVDLLYDFGMSGLSGQRPVSDAAPGDNHYNGGRWWVQAVVFTEAGLAAHDPDGDGMVNFELTSASMVLHHQTLGHVKIMETDTYFSCPLVGNGK